jgi:glutathione S-transferase
MKPQLYSGPLSLFGAKAEIALREKGVDFDLTLVAFSQAKGYSPKHPEVLRVSPLGKVPVLIDGAVEVFDSTLIFEYLEDRYPTPPLWPATPAARAHARELEYTADEIFIQQMIRIMRMRATPDPVDSPDWVQARAALMVYYAKMEKLLAGSEWLADDYSYADITFYMGQFFAARHTVPMTDDHPNLLAWRRRMAVRPAVALVINAMAQHLRDTNLPVPDYGA